ncbi:hypothetical protein GCM10027064_10480 [Microbacterium petrolearium]
MPERLVRERPGHRVTRHALRAALPTPRIVVDDAALKYCPVGLEQLPDGLKAELVEAAERGEVRGRERRVVQVEVFRRSVSVRTSILEDLDVYPRTSRRSRATPSTAKSPIEGIERQVEDYYRRVQIPEHIVTALRHMLVRQFDDLHAANKAESHTLAAERDKLRDERRSLLHAHHAGAVPLDLLKEEQDRIARRLTFLDAQIDAGQIEYDQAKAHLEDCLTLAGDMHAIYMSIDDSLRRICNQAFFERIQVYEVENVDTVKGEPGEPFDSLLDPNLHAAALTYEARLRAGEDIKPADVASLNIQYWVGPEGLEPSTYGLKVRCSTD